jgi:hypothetical protein
MDIGDAPLLQGPAQTCRSPVQSAAPVNAAGHEARRDVHMVCPSPQPAEPQSADGQYGVFFTSYQIATIDLTSNETVGDVSEQVSIMSPC